MFPSTPSRAGALVTVIVVLTGAITLPAAVADPNPDDQFVALLDQKGIPALENVPSLIATAHRICRQLDGGMPVDAVVDDMKQRAFNANAAGGPYPPDRVMRTVARFISASVEAYCPNNQPKMTSLQSMANRKPQSALHVVPAGETGQPDPPQLPPPPEPTAQILAPPPPVAPPLPRQQTPPPAQGPQQQPPAAPGPGGAPGSGGGAPESPPGPPGRVRLAP